MDYYAGLDVSMEETHICVVDRDGGVVHETRVASTRADIDAALMEASECRRVVFETGRCGRRNLIEARNPAALLMTAVFERLAGPGNFDPEPSFSGLVLRVD